MLTAAHCIYNRSTGAFATFTLRTGRNGSSTLGSTLSSIKWYLVPPEYQDTSLTADPFDIGYVVMWDDLNGGTLDGQDFFFPRALTATEIASYNTFNRGYPVCDPFVQGGVARIDEPCQGLSNQSCTVTLGVDTCQPLHLYGDPNACSIGNFSSLDGDSWNRNYQHSCDASAGQSGSPLYGLFDDEWVISGVHFFSLCGRTSADVACTASDTRALKATRITPTYLGYYNWLMSTKD